MIEGILGKLKVGDNFPARIFGVINLSKESFFKDSVVESSYDLENTITKMIDEGANGIDIGAQSTRPIQIYGGEGRLDELQEMDVVKTALVTAQDVLSSYDDIELSIDTTRSKVAEFSLKSGVRIINDISGFKKEAQMAAVIADYGASAILMAARLEPGDVYEIHDIVSELDKSISIGLEAGINAEKIILDPGIGSWEARDYKHDYSIIKNLREFRQLKKPIYVGISRKTFIGKALNDAPAAERLFGSLGATVVSIINGAHIIRTHDVKPTLEAIRVAEIIINHK